MSLSSSSNIFYSQTGALKMGSAKNAGTVTFSFASAKIEKVVINAKAWIKQNGGTDTNASAVVSTDVSSSVTKKVSTSFANYTIDFSSTNQEVTKLTVSSSGRIYLASITIYYGEVTPVYPTSIAVPSELDVKEGGKRAINVTYSPSNTNVKSLAFSSDDESIATVDKNGIVYGHSIGQTTIHVTALGLSGNIEKTIAVTVSEVVPTQQTSLKQTYEDYVDNNIWDISNCPTTGTAKLLVIPVWFTDSSTYISNRENVRSDIETAYFGTTTETGWNSVKSYYEAESFGNLELNGTVSEWYETGKATKAYYDYDKDNEDPTTDLATEASDWYFATHANEKRSDYDCDNDGYLDGVMLIYGAPDYDSYGGETRENLWAYCYWVGDPDVKSVSNPGANVYFWASYDFMYDSSTAQSRTGKTSCGAGDCRYCTVDAHTFTHEMGHVFGLEDYYDYSKRYNPAAGFSMQDNNVGGHDPFSVMALGWANPYIPTDSTTIEIGAFQKTHDLILLTPEWNEFDSPFDEYLLLELYTPTGLNAFDSEHQYTSDYPQGPKSVGIRLWHVDARLFYCNSFDRQDNPVASISQLTTDAHYNCQEGVNTAFTNSGSSSGYGSYLGSTYDKYDLLALIRNSTRASLHGSSDLSASDLFGNGSSFSMSSYSSQFSNSGKLNSGKDLGWSFSVTITGSGEDAVASVTLVRD